MTVLGPRPGDLAAAVQKVQARDAARVRDMLEVEGFDPAYVASEHEYVSRTPDRTATLGHALLAGLCENA